MQELIIKAVEQFSLITKGETVTVALSGGADSVSLLHALLSLKEQLEITVNAAHLNHGIRGIEADRDQAFAEQLCKALNVPLITEKADVPRLAKENHLSIEAAAREVRYEFLERVGGDKIATAHTASDNLETMIFNLARGTSLKGLCGIPPKRDIFIRPIILCTRQDVEDYCQRHKLSFVTDSTNLCDEYSRNKIRHNVIPVLKDINPNAEQSAMRTAISLSCDNLFLEKCAEEMLFKSYGENGLNIADFESISPAIAKRIIKKYFETLFCNITLDNRHICDIYSICLSGSGKLSLPNRLYAVVKDFCLSFLDDCKESVNEFTVKITETQKINNLFSNSLLDCDKIVGKLIVRTRHEGDTIRLNKRGCTKTLKKLFTENKVPCEIRDKLPVISDDFGVVWVHGMGVAQRCAVTKNTKKAFLIEVT